MRLPCFCNSTTTVKIACCFGHLNGPIGASVSVPWWAQKVAENTYFSLALLRGSGILLISESHEQAVRKPWLVVVFRNETSQSRSVGI